MFDSHMPTHCWIKHKKLIRWFFLRILHTHTCDRKTPWSNRNREWIRRLVMWKKFLFTIYMIWCSWWSHIFPVEKNMSSTLICKSFPDHVVFSLSKIVRLFFLFTLHSKNSLQPTQHSLQLTLGNILYKSYSMWYLKHDRMQNS